MGSDQLFFLKTDREVQNAAAIGGMRNPASAIMKSQGRHLEVGCRLFSRMSTLLQYAPRLRQQCLAGVGGIASDGPDAKFVEFFQ
eukprot:400272-Amphidinium_carterae.1